MMEEFNQNTDQLNINLNLLCQKIKLFDNFLSSLKKILKNFDEFGTVFKELENILYFSHIKLIFISKISLLETDIKIIDSGITKLYQIIKSQDALINTFTTTFIDPVIKNLDILHPKILLTIARIIKFGKEIESIKSKISSNENGHVNDIITKLNPIMFELNIFLEKLISDLDFIINKIDEVETRHTFIIALITDMKIFIGFLKKLDEMIKPLVCALDHEITIPRNSIRNWNLVAFWNYISEKNRYITYSINEIIDGIKDYDSQLIEILKYEAQKYLEPFIKKINFKNILPQIPYIEQIENEFGEFKNIISAKTLENISNRLDYLCYKVEFA